MLNRRKFISGSLKSGGIIGLATIIPDLAHAESSQLKNNAFSSADEGTLSSRIKSLTRASGWKLVNQIKTQFKTFHCQGMLKIGEDFWVSSVEVTKPPLKFSSPQGGFDRETGEGIGHLFKIDNQGKLIQDVIIGEGSTYHPSGIDFDGAHIWVTAAEYRPNSRSIIYRYDPKNNHLEEVFKFNDHIGGVGRNPADNTLHGMSWGSRYFYTWNLNKKGKLLTDVVPQKLRKQNTSAYIDYQDNQFIGNSEVIYTGVASYKNARGVTMSFGGLEVVDLNRQLPVFQIPIELYSPVSGKVMTQNPSYFESTSGGIRAYFMPDDDESIIYVYETEL